MSRLKKDIELFTVVSADCSLVSVRLFVRQCEKRSLPYHVGLCFRPYGTTRFPSEVFS